MCLFGLFVVHIGHVGLTPQTISVLGGFRAQGRTATKALRILDDALALQEAGAFALVVECVPSLVGQTLAQELDIPVIGIGAGPYTDGQVLVYHDVLGMTTHPHYEAFVPRFCKQYAKVGDMVAEGLEAYRKEVKGQAFPTDETYSPYSMSDAQKEEFTAKLRERRGGENTQEQREKTQKELLEKDEYAVEKLY